MERISETKLQMSLLSSREYSLTSPSLAAEATSTASSVSLQLMEDTASSCHRLEWRLRPVVRLYTSTLPPSVPVRLTWSLYKFKLLLPPPTISNLYDIVEYRVQCTFSMYLVQCIHYSVFLSLLSFRFTAKIFGNYPVNQHWL